MPFREGKSMGSAAIVALLLLALVGCSSATAAPAPSAAGARYPVTTCPTPAVHPTSTGTASASRQLIPFTPDHALLCRYKGLGRGVLTASATITSRATMERLRDDVNHDVSRAPSGTVNCPNDTGGSVDAFLWSGSRHIEVQVLTSGCEYASNGTIQSAWVARSDILKQLAEFIAE